MLCGFGFCTGKLVQRLQHQVSYIHTHTRTHTHAHIHAHTHSHTHTHTHTHTHVHTHTGFSMGPLLDAVLDINPRYLAMYNYLERHM